MQIGKAMITQARHSRLFRKISFFFSSLKKQVPPYDLWQVHFELRYDMLCEDVQQQLINRIELYRLLGHQVKVSPLTKNIKPEYIGVVSFRNVEKLLFQEYLQMRVEYIEKKTIVSQRIYPSIH